MAESDRSEGALRLTLAWLWWAFWLRAELYPLQVQLLIHYRTSCRLCHVQQLPEQAALPERKQHEVLQQLLAL